MLDVASGTAAVSIALARAAPARTIVGIDQSTEMLAAGRARVERAGLASRIELREGRAEALPFADAEFDALTFTYLLRYVDDPAATLRELVRVVKPGGTIAMQEFGLPRGDLAAALGALRARRAAARGRGRLARAGTRSGASSARASASFYERLPLDAQLDLWREAGIADVRCRRLSVGGGVVVWGTRA